MKKLNLKKYISKFTKPFNNISNNFERWILNHIGLISIIFGVLITLAYLNYSLRIEYFFTSILAILGFWYGYKKYEETKKLNFIYSNLIIDDGKYDKNTFSKDITNFFMNLELYKLGVIKEEVWYIIESNFEEKLIGYIFENEGNIELFVAMSLKNKQYIINKLENIKKIIIDDGIIHNNLDVFIQHLKNINNNGLK